MLVYISLYDTLLSFINILTSWQQAVNTSIKKYRIGKDVNNIYSKKKILINVM